MYIRYNNQSPRSGGNSPPTGQGHNPPAGQGHNSPTVQGHNPPTGQGHNPPTGQGHNPPAGQGHNPPTGQGHNSPTGQGHNSPTGQGHNPPTGQGHNPPPKKDIPPRKESFGKNPLAFLPREIYDPKTHKFFGFITAEDILLIGLILLVLDSDCDDKIFLAIALGYILLSDYFDFGNILF